MKPSKAICGAVLIAFWFVITPALLVSCMTDGSSAISTINATITHTEAGDWIGGLTFTFKSMPSEFEIKTMKEAGAKRVTEKVFVLPPKDK